MVLKNDEKKWELIGLTQKLILPAGLLAIIFGLLTLAGYWLEIEVLYRPRSGGPATNPMTSMIILLLGCALILSTMRKEFKALSLVNTGILVTAGLAIILASAPIFDLLTGAEVHYLLTPFQTLVAQELTQGKSNSIGGNSALLFLLISFSILCFKLKFLMASQVISFFSLVLPFVSVTGYAYGFEEFYGQMSFYTASFGLMLGISTLFLTAKEGFLIGILSPHVGGVVARYQVVVAYIFPTLVGWVIVKSLFDIGEGGWFGSFVVAVSWFIFMMIGISAYYQEIIDKERRSHEKELARAAQYDELTGIPNRRVFFERGELEIARVKRTEERLFILMLDIDHFKNINDTAGHDVGDKVLVAVAHLFQSSIRDVDLVARLGGEEFAILLVGANEEGVKRVAESLMQKLKSMPVDGWTEDNGAITVSIGCTEYNESSSIRDMLKNADEAMYQSKSNGRNQVTYSLKRCIKLVRAEGDNS